MDNLTFEVWKSRIRDSILGIAAILFIVILYLFTINNASESIISTEYIVGKLVGMHQIQSNTGSRRSIFSIQLNNGKTITINIEPTDNVPFKKDNEVTIIKYTKESGYVYYDFDSYIN